jgi:alcohol dehydrogenase class IV
MYQNFCKSIGYGNRGYGLLVKDSMSVKNIILISGSKSNYRYLISKLERIYKKKPKHILLKKNRFEIEAIENIYKQNKKKKIDAIIALGGGSIIDFSKRLILKFRNKKKTNFYILPSILGSGSEISITSIINTSFGKNFIVNEKFLPDGIIYDENLIKTSNKVTTLMGVLDSMTHCIESYTSINKNYYLNFLCNETLNYFIKKNPLKTLVDNKSFNYFDIATLSLNGGLAQSNAGSGICHALTHSSEEMLKIKHAEGISFFLLPVLKYLKIKNKKDLNGFDDKLLNYIAGLTKYLRSHHKFKKLKNSINEKSFVKNLIDKSKSDICWRLYNKNIDINLLIQIIKNEKY